MPYGKHNFRFLVIQLMRDCIFVIQCRHRRRRIHSYEYDEWWLGDEGGNKTKVLKKIYEHKQTDNQKEKKTQNEENTNTLASSRWIELTVWIPCSLKPTVATSWHFTYLWFGTYFSLFFQSSSLDFMPFYSFTALSCSGDQLKSLNWNKKSKTERPHRHGTQWIRFRIH